MLTCKEILKKAVEMNASDVHLSVGEPPIYRVDGFLRELAGAKILDDSDIRQLVFEVCTPSQKEILLINKELDFSFDLEENARFRVNAFFERGSLASAFRKIPLVVPTLSDLAVPSVVTDLCRLKQGLVLVTGASGQGKSTTLAAMIDYINKTRSEHIITIEDPIEYLFKNEKSIIQQRELHTDTHSWESALKSSLRQDPNVLLVGEMRDLETVSSAITIAETGHLVFATLHTNSASQAVDRVIDVFPQDQQNQIRVQLSMILEGVIRQRLVPQIKGGRIASFEVLLATPAVRNLIREGKTHQIDNVIATSLDFGMLTLERSLADLIKQGKVSLEEAKKHSSNPSNLARIVSKNYGNL